MEVFIAWVIFFMIAGIVINSVNRSRQEKEDWNSLTREEQIQIKYGSQGVFGSHYKYFKLKEKGE
jgi:hypothetical protein